MTSARRPDRLNAALLRAVAVEPRAELRSGRVSIGDRSMPIVVPYLVVASADRSQERSRGVVDALGLRVRHSDPDLHRVLGPDPLLERVVFDIAEQFQCEALADPALPGIGRNTRAAFERWSDCLLYTSPSPRDS